MESILFRLENEHLNTENMLALVRMIENVMSEETYICDAGIIRILSDLLESHAKNLELILNLWQEGHRA